MEFHTDIEYHIFITRQKKVLYYNLLLYYYILYYNLLLYYYILYYNLLLYYYITFL